MSAPWPVVRLGDVLQQFKEYIDAPEQREYPKLSVKLYGKGVTLDTSVDGSTLKMKRHQLAHSGQVILSEIWGKKGAIGFVPPEGEGALCTSHFFLFDFNERILERGWLRALFKANFLAEQLGAKAFGTTGYAAVRPKDLLVCKIPLPPLPEQRRIVEKIEKLAGLVEEAKRLYSQTKLEVNALFESSLSAIFTRLSTSEPVARLGDVCEVVRGGSPRPAGSSLYYDGQIPFLKVADITADTSMFLSTYTATIKEAGLNKTRLVPAGTLMLTNSGATLGVPKICTFKTTFNDGIQAFLEIPSDIQKPYLYWFFASRTCWFREVAARGQGQPNLNTTMVKDLYFPRPPLSSQGQVVEYCNGLLERCDWATRIRLDTATELNAMMAAILDRAFKGEL